MLDYRLMTIILRDREREIAEAIRVRTLLDGWQPDSRRPIQRDDSPSIGLPATPRIAFRSR
jgi:hypothetical protein